MLRTCGAANRWRNHRAEKAAAYQTAVLHGEGDGTPLHRNK